MANAKVTVEGSSSVGGVVAADLGKANSALREFEKNGQAAGSAAGNTGNSIGSLAGQIQALGAAVAASKLLQLVGDLVQTGAAADRMGTSLNALTGGRADDYIEAIGEASLGTVSDMNAMTFSARALQLGVVDSTSEMAELTQAALVLGRAMGIDAAEAMDKLIIGIGRLSPLRLDDLGLSVKMADVQAEANLLMEQNASLTFEAAQRQAIYNQAMAQANELLEAQGGLQNDAAAELERFNAEIDNGKAAVGEWLVDGLLPWVEGTRMVSDAFAEQSQRVLESADTYEEWRAGMVEAVNTLGPFGELILRLTGGLDLTEEAFQKAKEAVKENKQELVGWGIAAQATGQRWAEYTDLNSTSLEELTAAFETAGAAVQNYLQVLEQQSAMQLELIQQIPQFMDSQQGMVDVFGLGANALSNYNLSATETLRLYQELGLATGELTAAEIAQSQAVQQLTNLWVDSQISGQQYAEALAAIQAGADAATVSQQIMTEAATAASQAYADQAAAIVEAEGSAAQAAAAMQAAQQAYNDTMSAMQETADPATAALADAQTAVDELFAALENAPESVETAFKLEAGDALGQLNDLIGLMNDVSQPVVASIDATAATTAAGPVGDLNAMLEVTAQPYKADIATTAAAAFGDVDGLAGKIDALQDRTITITANVVYNDSGGPGGEGAADADGKAVGGPIKAGTPYLVGEQGPEMILPSSPGYVLTASETSALMGDSGEGSSMVGGGIQIGNMTLVLPGVVNAVDFVPELQRELRNLGLGFAPLGVAA